MHREIHWPRTNMVQLRDQLSSIAILAVCVVILYAVPIGLVENGVSICLFKAVTGHECIGCGQTRAFFHIIHGDIVGAYRLNKLSPLVFLLLNYIAIKWCMRNGDKIFWG